MRNRPLLRLLPIFLAAGVLLVALPSPAEPPARELPFSRNVTLAVPGTYTLRFSLWDAATGGEMLWSEVKAVTLATTTLKHMLGSVDPEGNPLDPSLFSRQLWVQVERWRAATSSWRPVGARTRLNAAAYALHSLSDEAGSITSVEIRDGSVAGVDLQDGAALSEILDDDGAGSGLDADMVDGLHALELTGSVREHDEVYVNEGQPDSVTTAMLTDGAVTAAKIFPCAEGDALVYLAGTWRCAALAAVQCSPGDMVSCYRGPAGTLDAGACRAGRRTCNESGTGYGECLGEVLPSGEVCDGLDNDCNGLIDDGVPGTPVWHPDEDGDGYGDPDLSLAACTQPLRYVARAGDCDDSRWSLSPDMGEICDGLDNDCDGVPDDQCAAAACGADEIDSLHACIVQCGTNPTCRADCVVTAGLSHDCLLAVQALVACGESCFSTGVPGPLPCLREACPGPWAAAFGPVCEEGSTRPCGTDAGECTAGTRTCTGGAWPADCAGSVGPAPEICRNGLDENCNGVADDPEACADLDQDGWFAVSDCDDGDASVNPSETEACNDKDDNCDGVIDGPGSLGCVEYYIDSDGDNFGIESSCLCHPAWPYLATQGGDCDDSNGFAYPGALEICDGVDNNCDGLVDNDAASCTPYYRDADSDTWGTSDYRCLCSPEWPHVAARVGDCRDTNDMAYPGATEFCNGIDDNCDGQVDEPGASGCRLHYHDADGDGRGDPYDALCLCAPGGGYVANNLDCDDTNPARYTDAFEVCDGIDNNCDGMTDPYGSGGCTGYWLDNDRDGYGRSGFGVCSCTPEPPYDTLVAGDCNDSNAAVHPGAVEICGNGLDDDCVGGDEVCP